MAPCTNLGTQSVTFSGSIQSMQSLLALLIVTWKELYKGLELGSLYQPS